MEKRLNITKTRLFWEHIQPVPWPFIISKFHYSWFSIFPVFMTVSRKKNTLENLLRRLLTSFLSSRSAENSCTGTAQVGVIQPVDRTLHSQLVPFWPFQPEPVHRLGVSQRYSTDSPEVFSRPEEPFFKSISVIK